MAGSISNVDSTDLNDNQVMVIESGDDASTNRAHVSTENRLKVDAKLTEFTADSLGSFFLEVARGSYPQYTFISKFGASPEIDDDELRTVWDVPDTLYPWPTSAQTTTIVSSSANDTSSGTGARTVEVQGLNSSYVFISETITLNGTSSVTLSNQYLRVFRAKVLTAGSTGWNEGDIDIQHGSTVIARITIQINQTLMALYTMPANTTGYLYEWHSEVGPKVGSDADKVGRSYLQIRQLNSVFQTKDYRYHDSNGAQIDQKYQCPLVIAEKSDIVINVLTPRNNCSFSSGFFILQEDTSL